MSRTIPTLQPLKNKNFRELWIAGIISQAGLLIQIVAASWMMTEITDSRSMVAMVQVAAAIPMLFFSIPMGVLADNFNRRRLMISAQIMMAICSTALAVFGLLGWLNPFLLLMFTFLVGSGTALHNPAWQSSYRDILKREELPATVTLNSMGYNLMRSVGPVLGGLIIALGSISIAFLINALSYFPLIAALLRWKPNLPERKLPPEDFTSSLSAGIRYVLMSPNLLKVMLRAFVFGGAATALVALLPLITGELLGGEALRFGSLLGSFGAGALIGGLLSPYMRQAMGNEWVVRWASVGSAFAIAVLALHHALWSNYIVLVIAGACWMFAMPMFNASFQMAVPRWVLARALSLYHTAFFSGLALGSLIWGMVADAYGLEAALLAAAAVLLCNVLIGVVLRFPDFPKDDLAPLYESSRYDLAIEVEELSGPILISVEYEIAETDIPEFLEIAAQRRRIRIRDGARRWSLSRDLHRPEIWIESYRVPTWLAYQLHIGRRTKADAIVTEKLFNLHKGSKHPHVSRMVSQKVGLGGRGQGADDNLRKGTLENSK